jgi:hypothetical protein
MEAILKLERMGYRFCLNGNSMHFEHVDGESEPEETRSLLEYLDQNRDEAVSFLRAREAQGGDELTGIEAEAVALLDHMDSMDKLEWCRQWAEVMTRLRVPCTGNDSWLDWFVEVRDELRAVAEPG